MAYAERYFHLFCDRYGNQYRASIHEDGFEGDAQLVEGGPSPVVIRYESFSDFKFDPIRASQCILTLISSPTFSTQNLYTGDEKKFKVSIQKNGSLYWVGYMMPNGLKEDFRSPPSYITITASDYLPGIKNIKYLQADGSQYMGRYTFLDVMNQCLAKTELGLGLDTYVNVYPAGITAGPTVDPLNEVDINVQTFIENRQRELPDRPSSMSNPRPRDKYPSQTVKSNEQRPMNCYEVLNYNATLWQSRLFQEGARWKIERINNKYLQNTIRRYDPSGTLTGTAQHPAPRQVSCLDQTVKLVGGVHTLAMDRVFKRVTTEYRFAFGDTQNNVTQFLRNGDFEDYVPVGQWNYWRGTPGVVPVHVQIGSDTGIAISNFSKKHLYAESWPIQVTEGDELMIDFRIRLTPGSTANRVLFALFQIVAKGRFDFSTGGQRSRGGASAREAFLAANVTPAYWDGGSMYIAFPIRPDQKGIMTTRSIVTEPIPGNGELFVRLLGTADEPSVWQEDFDWGVDDLFQIGVDGRGDPVRVSSTYGVMEVYDIKVGKITKPVDKDSSTTSYVVEQDLNFTDEPDVITIINADDQELDHISDIRIKSTDVRTSQWYVEGQPDYGTDTIGKIVSRSVLEQYKQPYHIIEGDIKGPDLAFSDIFNFDMPGLENEQFMVQRGDFDLLKSELRNAVLVQISDTEVESDGTIDGNDTTPNWVRTGWERCIRDQDGKTTGETEAEEKDYNPYSLTYGETRWVNIGNIGGCGGNDYYEFLWGASGESLTASDLINWPFSEGADQVTTWFGNDGGKWLWFLHRPEHGTVTSILDVEGEETIADWSYQSDVVIDGVTFKAMRMDYYTGIYSGLPKTFLFT